MKESEIQQHIKEGWIRLKSIFEIAGFPEEHIAETIKLVAEKLSKEQIKIIDQKIREPKKISEKMFSAFIEMEFLAQSLTQIMGLIYDYLPSSIEIIEPEDPISDDPQAMSELLNDLIAKLHRYNQAIHALQAENIVLKKNQKE